MRNLLAAVLFSTAALACTKTADPTPTPGSATTAVADPAPAPAPSSGGATAAAPTPTSAPAAEAAPDLVEATPGVQVVADYDTPVFFNAGMYWRFNDGGWYSSSVYTGGWELRASPPAVIVSIDRPERFVHYRPSGYVARRRPAPQREWHPAPVHAEVRVEPKAEIRVEPKVEVRVEPPHADVRVEVRTPTVVIKPGAHH